MRTTLFLFTLLSISLLNLSAQGHRDRENEDIYRRISTDIFDNLKYEYFGTKATLTKDIFNDITYKDNNNNKVKYKEEQWSELLNKFEGDNKNCFIWLINLHTDIHNQETSYSKNIFGDEIITDDRGNSETYKRDIFDNLVYKNDKNQNATFKKDIFDRWEYSDSRNNRKEYNKEEWDILISRYKSEDAIFKLLINKYLLSDNF